MTNDNETVEQVCECVEYLAGTDGGGLEIFGEHINPISLADRILTAHKREIGELKGERKGILKANDAFAADNTRLRGELAEKDAENEKLRALVKELADALEDRTCKAVCELYCTEADKKDCVNLENRALVAKARKMTGGVE